MSNSTVARDIRVREKLIIYGAHLLSDVELLAILISSGSAKKSCYELALDLIHQFRDLRAVLNADFKSFQSIPGLGVVRYAQLQAAREICRRSDFIQLQKDICLSNSKQTHHYLKRQLRDKKNETFVALFLDAQHRIIAYEELFSGTVNSATIHPRPIIDRVLKLNAAAVILAHNHPSGLSDASQHDVEATQKLQDALELVDVKLLDHLIVGDNEIYSIRNSMKWICH